MRSNLIEFCRRRYRGAPASALSDYPNFNARLNSAAGLKSDAWMFRGKGLGGPSAGAAASNDHVSWHPGTGAFDAADSDPMSLPAIADALCQAHKMEILGQMAGGLAHSFNNLLQGVMSAINLMHNRIPPENSAELDFLIGHAFTSVKGVGTLSQRLLEFARPRRPEARVIDANTLIVRMQDLLRCALLPGIDLRIELGAGPMETICDNHQFENTLLDLVLNAREAMPGGGMLTIKTMHADLAIQRAGLTAGRYVGICVGDTGVGISPDALEHIFDPFYTTKTTGHRTGLGLPLAGLFVERFQGHIGIETALGRGTQVWLYLPCRPV
jgi:signal transduction histidine kinase